MKSDATTFSPSAFLENPKLVGVLFYGTEEGLKDYFIATFSHLKRLTRLAEEAFLENPSHYLTPDLFRAEGTEPVLCIEDVSDKKSKAYEAILTAMPASEGKLILWGPALKTTSKLVQFAVKHMAVQAVGCYPLELRQMPLLLQKAAPFFQLTFTPEALKALVFLVRPATLFQDLTKLSLYKAGEIDLEDIVACLGEAQEETLELAFALSGRRPDHVAQLLSKAAEKLEPMMLIRQAMHHFLRLLQVRCALENKVPLTQALGQLSPPLFFKKAPLFQAHLQTWSLPQIYKALALLEKAEMAVKSTLPTYEAVAYYLSQIARPQKIL